MSWGGEAAEARGPRCGRRRRPGRQGGRQRRGGRWRRGKNRGKKASALGGQGGMTRARFAQQWVKERNGEL